MKWDPGRTWTVEEVAQAYGFDQCGLTAEEWALVRAVAEAGYFAHHLTEAPARFPAMDEGFIWDAFYRVLSRRPGGWDAVKRQREAAEAEAQP